jgi:hypothetical protein
VDLPTYTNIWRIEKRLYKLYDFRLPMPLPINWIAVFAGITVPYIVLLIAIGLPFNHTLVWLYVLPPGLLTWLTTRPVIENKRLPELLESQVRYLAEPRVWTRLAPLKRERTDGRHCPRVARAPGGTAAQDGQDQGSRGHRRAARRKRACSPRCRCPRYRGSRRGQRAAGGCFRASRCPRDARGLPVPGRARARGTGPQVPAPGPSGRQRPPGRRT